MFDLVLLGVGVSFVGSAARAQQRPAAVPVYEEVEGWQCNTTGICTYAGLPAAAKKYLQRLEELLETPIAMISVGPQRGKTIQVKDILATEEYDARYPRNAMR